MIGKTIANHRVTALIGQGGMGEVYAAEHAILRRRAAIKILHRNIVEDAGIVQRFINEARAAAAIQHRNVIEIIDVGTIEDGVPYILMEYLEGESLGDRIRRLGRIGVGDAVEIACQAANALAVAHQAGIVHRDLKPENLYLIPDLQIPKRTLVKVLDFGIAKLRGEWGGTSMAKTSTGSIMGTPPYMAPEQCRGLHDEIDARTDVYALGIIMFEMLCGQPPFMSKGWGDVLVMHITEPPPRPSTKNPEIPDYLDSVILRALAKGQDDRHPDMGSLQRALEKGRQTINTSAKPAEATAALANTVHAPAEADATVTNKVAVVQTASPNVIALTTLSGASGVWARTDANTGNTETAKRKRRWLLMAVGVVGVFSVVGLVLALSRSPAGLPPEPAASSSAAGPVAPPPDPVTPAVATPDSKDPPTTATNAVAGTAADKEKQGNTPTEEPRTKKTTAQSKDIANPQIKRNTIPHRIPKTTIGGSAGPTKVGNKINAATTSTQQSKQPPTNTPTTNDTTKKKFNLW